MKVYNTKIIANKKKIKKLNNNNSNLPTLRQT